MSRPSGSAADSYIGSLISLTSKSGIRYEGVLYNINTDESSIGLRDVRSFGTEGRNKDSPQIPPSDRVYEYILFRGSDIKDLQVKSSPAIQTPSPVNNDPAIIQSQHPPPTQASTSLPDSAVSSTTNTSLQTSQLEQSAPNVHSGAPFYQPGENVGTWEPSPSSAIGSGNGMPMYWQGYYASPGGQLSHQNQQPLMRPPGLSVPPLLQQQTNHYLQQQMPPLQLPSSLQQQVPSSVQPQMPSPLQPQMPASSLKPQMPSPLQQQMPSSLQPQMSSSLQQQMPSSLQPQTSSSLQQQIPYSLQQMPSLLQQQLASSLHQHLTSMNQQMPSLHQPLHYTNLITQNVNSTLPAPPSLFTSGTSSGPSGIINSTSSSTSALPSNLPPTFPFLPVTSLALDAASNPILTKTPIVAALPNKTPATSLLPETSLLGSGLDGNTLLQPLPSIPATTTGQTSQQNANLPQATPSKIVGGQPIATQAPAPALLTPGHFVKSLSIPSAPSMQIVHKDVEVVQVSSTPVELLASVELERKPSVLPLATPSKPLYKQIGSLVQSYSGYRGRGRGRGRMNLRPLTAFNEEFDFTAMNEKFKKDEVWGHLGKSSKTNDQQNDGKHVDEEFLQQKDLDLPKIDIKPVYSKDDFFDSLSSNTRDQESNHGRHNRFSEQRKIDTETFGELSRYRGGRGGHGPGRGNYRGSFNGRGYGRGGYGYGRGRGRGGPSRVS